MAGRIQEQQSQQQTSTTGRLVSQSQGMGTSGRIQNQTTIVPDDLTYKPQKMWDDLSFGGKIWETTKAVPYTLAAFMPNTTKVASEGYLKGLKGETINPIDAAVAGAKDLYQFGKGVVDTTVQGIGGGILSALESSSLSKEPYLKFKVTVPVLKDLVPEVSSWGEQVKTLEDQGFSKDEARTLVGINAYNAVMPIVAKGLKTPAGRALTDTVTKTEVPTSETVAGARIEANTGVVPEGTTQIERPTLTAAKRLVGQTETQQAFKADLDGYLKQYFGGRDKILSREEPLNQALVKLSPEELNTYARYTQGLVSVDKPSPALKNAVELWKNTSTEIENDLIDRGVFTRDQIENRKWKPVEVTTGRTRQELEKLGVEPVYYPYLAEDLLKKRDFVPSTGRRTWGSYTKRFTGKMLAEDSYIKDPKIAIPRHQIQVFRDMMNGEFVEQIKNDFAEKDAALIKKFEESPATARDLGYVEWKPAGTLRFFPAKTAAGKIIRGVTKNVEKYWVPEDVAKEMDKFFRPGLLEKTMRLTYDPAMDIWRTSVLSLSPRWVFNNFMGNLTLSTLAKTGPLDYLKAGRESLARGALGEKLGLEPNKFPEGVLAKVAAGGEGDTNVARLGSSAKETTQFMRPVENWLNLLERSKKYPALRIPAATTQNIIKGIMAAGKPLGKLNSVIENFFRSAIYIAKTKGEFLGPELDKPPTPSMTDGVKYVNEFLHDYGKLSRQERMTFRRVLPFWNWTRFITEFSLKFPVNHPVRAYAVNALLQEYVDYISTVNQKDDKQKDVLRIKTDAIDSDGKPIYINVKSAIPFSDLFKTLPTSFDAVRKIMTSNPVSKIILERGFKVNSFTGAPFTTPKSFIQKDEYGKDILPLPSLTRHIGQQFPQTDLVRDVVDSLLYGKVLKRYDTGEVKQFGGQPQTSDTLMEILKYFGVSLSPMEVNRLQNKLNSDDIKQSAYKKVYEQQVKTGVQRLMKQWNLGIPKAQAATFDEALKNAHAEADATRYTAQQPPEEGQYVKQPDGSYSPLKDFVDKSKAFLSFLDHQSGMDEINGVLMDPKSTHEQKQKTIEKITDMALGVGAIEKAGFEIGKKILPETIAEGRKLVSKLAQAIEKVTESKTVSAVAKEAAVSDSLPEIKSMYESLYNEYHASEVRGLTTPAALTAGAAATGAAVAATTPQTISYTDSGDQPVAEEPVNISKTKEALAHNETGIKLHPYEFHKFSGDPALGDDNGKYQITTAELRERSKQFLGRQVDVDEFLKSPDLQEKYMEAKIKYLADKGLSPQEIAVSHRGGFSDLTPEALKGKLKKYAKYVTSFNNVYAKE